MTASRSKLSFVRRSLPEDRHSEIIVPFNDEEYAVVEAEADALGLSVEDFLIMRVLDAGRVKGHA